MDQSKTTVVVETGSDKKIPVTVTRRPHDAKMFNQTTLCNDCSDDCGGSCK